MKKLSANLNIILTTALVTAVFCTWICPIVLKLLFTPPVSFGTNCEPAAAWSMSKLIWTQFIGLLVGAVLGAVLIVSRKPKGESAPKVT